jgi:predicted dehydrogenase
VNAGHIDRNHWSQDPQLGGGRIVGEACHFIDLARFLVGSPITDLSVDSAVDADGRPIDDVSHLTISFADGSTAAVHYLAFFDGRTAAIDNWRRLRTWGFGRRNRLFARRMNKGHEAELESFATAVRDGGRAPIPYEEIFEVSRWSIRAAEQARGRFKSPSR